TASHVPSWSNTRCCQSRLLLCAGVTILLDHVKLNNPTLEIVVEICIGLELIPTYSEEILRLAGYTLNNTPQQLAYKKLIHSYRGHSIYECNEVLEALGLSPLCAKAYKEMIS